MGFIDLHRRRLARLALLLIASLPPLAARAAEPPLTLEAAVSRGVARAPLVQARGDSLAASRADADRAGRLPDPALSVGLANYPLTEPGAFSASAEPMTMRTVGVSQAIPSRATRDAERHVADARIGVASAERTATAQSTREQIAAAWIALWAQDERREQLATLREESALAVEIAAARLRGGSGGVTDVLAAQAAALVLANRIDGIDAEQRAARADLQRWIGADAPPLAPAPDFGQLPEAPAVLERAVDRQAPMRIWAARERVAKAALAEARASRHPDWRVGVAYGNRAPGRPDMVSLEFGVSLPLFTRHRQDAAVSAEHAAWRAAQAERDDARREQRATVAAALSRWQGWGLQIARDRDTLLPLARDRARTALAAFRGGASLQPWIDARRDEIELRLAYVDALAARAREWAALEYLLPAQEGTP